MARLKGLIDFEGTIGGINAYTLNGERVIRKSRSSQKEKMKTGANYERTRENMMEFSGAVAAAKVLRQSLMPVARNFVDPSFTGTLQGKYRDMISVASGKRGQRVFKPLQHADAIRAIPFDKALHLDSVLGVKPVVTTNGERTLASLFLSINTATDLFTPTGATHVEFIYAISVQPCFEYDAHFHKYKRTDGLDQHVMQTISSALIPLYVNETVDVSLTPQPIELLMLQADSALVSVLGIRFHQQIGFKTYALETGKVMGFIAVS